MYCRAATLVCERPCWLVDFQFTNVSAAIANAILFIDGAGVGDPWRLLVDAAIRSTIGNCIGHPIRFNKSLYVWVGGTPHFTIHYVPD